VVHAASSHREHKVEHTEDGKQYVDQSAWTHDTFTHSLYDTKIFTQVREVLWEARQAAEFAAAARAAAIFQRTDDSRQLCVIRREWKKLVRQHKRDILVVRATKAAEEQE